MGDKITFNTDRSTVGSQTAVVKGDQVVHVGGQVTTADLARELDRVRDELRKAVERGEVDEVRGAAVAERVDEAEQALDTAGEGFLVRFVRALTGARSLVDGMSGLTTAVHGAIEAGQAAL